MTICRDWLLVKTQGSVATAEPLRCRSWGCELCAPDRRKRLIAQAIGGLPNTFITLTVNPAYGTSPEHRARMLVAAWRTIRRWASSEHAQICPLELEHWRADQRWTSKPSRPRDILGREHPDNGTIPFLAVFEKTKRGEPHLHIMARCEWVPQAWLSRTMEYLIGAPIVHVSRITNPAKMAAYCAKYAGKEPHAFGSCKRYWASQDYELAPPEKDESREGDGVTFEIFRGDRQEWITQREREGWMVEWEGDRLVAHDMRRREPPKEGVLVRAGAPPAGVPPDRTGQASARYTSLITRS